MIFMNLGYDLKKILGKKCFKIKRNQSKKDAGI